ncbi:MAG: hypothetical protein M1817_003005 [Caeruleum heppii]|nr:MAG: hypothetical protein M1817_003005 [Caeruleum heppii]
MASLLTNLFCRSRASINSSYLTKSPSFMSLIATPISSHLDLSTSQHTSSPRHFQLRPTQTSITPQLLSPRRHYAAESTTKKSLRQRPDPRLTQLRYHLLHPLSLTPRPLRLSRMRTLRHWTIHRAYLLHRRQRLERTERALERQYNSMRDACEALRTLPGDEGRLYRRAMVKKGVFGTHGGNAGGGDQRQRDGGWPIEASRGQTEWPGRENGGWNVGWRR